MTRLLKKDGRPALRSFSRSRLAVVYEAAAFGTRPETVSITRGETHDLIDGPQSLNRLRSFAELLPCDIVLTAAQLLRFGRRCPLDTPATINRIRQERCASGEVIMSRPLSAEAGQRFHTAEHRLLLVIDTIPALVVSPAGPIRWLHERNVGSTVTRCSL
jgi:hypothetical protein